MADLLLQKGGPVVEMDHHSVITAKGMAISLEGLDGLPDPTSEPRAGGRAMDIEQLLDTDNQQASTQTEPVDSPSPAPTVAITHTFYN